MIHSLAFYITAGVLFACFQPFIASPLENYSNNGYVASLILHYTTMFFVGMILASVVRFVAPKRAHVITFLGTTPIHVLDTGIKFTLPWPLGYTHSVVSTDIQDMPIKIQVKPKDNLVYMLPVNVQWYVTDPMLYALERKNPNGQAENLLTAAIRSAASSLTLFQMYNDKDTVQSESQNTVGKELLSFGIKIKEIVVQDPHLPESTARKLSAIREAEFDKQAATEEALAIYERLVGKARAEAESTRLKGAALANFRLLIAEGNAAAIAVMQGKLTITWADETIGEGDSATTIKIAKFIKPKADVDGINIPEIDISPEVILDFFKVVDGNDAIRDAAASGNTVVISTNTNSGDGIPAALLKKLDQLKS